MDAHKWLYAPVDAGLVLLRDGGAARDTFSLVPAYLRTDGDEDGPGGPVWFSEYGLEQTRPFRALKVWMQLRHLGRDGYRRLIAADLATAGELRRAVAASADFELLASGLSVVCFRHRPAGKDPAGTVGGMGPRPAQPGCAQGRPAGRPGVPGRDHRGRRFRAAGLHREPGPDRRRVTGILDDVRAGPPSCSVLANQCSPIRSMLANQRLPRRPVSGGRADG